MQYVMHKVLHTNTKFAMDEWSSRTLKVIKIAAISQSIYHVLSMDCRNDISILHGFGESTTLQCRDIIKGAKI